MKQTFTLVAAIVLSFLTANAQISQNFESASNLSQLTSACWQFSGLALSTASQVNGANCLQVSPTPNGSVNGTITTPYANLTSGASISFNYRLSSALAQKGDRSIAVLLQAYNGTYITLTTVTMNNQSPTTIQTLSTTSTASGVYKIVITVAGNSDKNNSVLVDDITAAGTFNYNAPYNCNSTSNTTLPVQLKGFQAVLQGEQVRLQWQVAENGTGDYFEIEKSTDGHTFKTLAMVATTDKQGDETYAYTLAQQGTSYYRLKIVNKNKTLSYSNIVFAKEQTTAASALNLMQNPVKENLQFSFNATSAGIAEVVVYNVNGSKVFQTKLTVQKGLNNLSASLSNISMKGTYLLEVRTTELRSVVKFLKD